MVISNISQGNLSFINTRNVSQEYYDNLQEARKPQSGDILFTVTGSYGIVIFSFTHFQLLGISNGISFSSISGNLFSFLIFPSLISFIYGNGFLWHSHSGKNR